jgi:hypothetical protein
MNPIFDILNQPVVITLISLVVGGYLLNVIAERRTKTDKIREKSIDFINEVGNHIAGFTPHIYEQLRQGRTSLSPDGVEAFRDLFSTRMSVQVGSQAYLKSKNFHLQYFQILDEFMKVVVCMNELEQENNPEETVKKIRDHQKRLSESWPLPDETSSPNTKQPVEELIAWMDMIMRRATHFLTTNLNDILG